MIPEALVAAAVHIINSSGIVELLNRAIRTTKRGRPANPNDLRCLLIGMLLSVNDNGCATLADIYKLLSTRLTASDQIYCGYRRMNGTTVPLTRLEYLSKTLQERLAYGRSATDLTDDERERRHRVICDMSDALMDVFDLGWKATEFAMDATALESWCRPRKGVNQLTPDEIATILSNQRSAPNLDPNFSADDDSTDDAADGAASENDDDLGCESSDLATRRRRIDLDATFGKRTPRYGRNRLTKDGKESFFGYFEHTLVQVDDNEPKLIRRLEVATANDDVVAPSLRLLTSINGGVRDLIVDRHYSYKQFDRWNAELIKLGIRQVLDLRNDEQGFIENNRMRWAAGAAHCPATPDHLAEIPRPGPQAPQSELVTFIDRIKDREQYAMRVVNQPDASGATRLECPALAGKVGCPLRPATEAAALEHQLLVIANPPTDQGEGLPRCCTQNTVKVTPTDNIRKQSQHLYWGSSKWLRKYNKRTHVEGSYGNRKNPATENLNRGITRGTGLVWMNLIAAMTATSYNLRMLNNWQQRSGRLPDDHPLVVGAGGDALAVVSPFTSGNEAA